MNDRALDLLNEAKEYLASADSKQEAADADKWAAAERMWRANREEGVNQREIAGIVGVSQATVNVYIRVWEAADYRANQGGQSFTERYYAAKGSDSEDSGDRHAIAVLKDPRRRTAVFNKLPSDVVTDVAEDAAGTVHSRASAQRHEHGEVTAADAARASRVQMQHAERVSRSERMTEIRTGIRAISEMDVDEFYAHYAGISGSDAGLSNFARVIDEAIDKLEALKVAFTEGVPTR